MLKKSLKNVTPFDVYFCRDKKILDRKKKIKQLGLNERSAKTKNRRAECNYAVRK